MMHGHKNMKLGLLWPRWAPGEVLQFWPRGTVTDHYSILLYMVPLIVVSNLMMA
jgi:hypothetical protein